MRAGWAWGWVLWVTSMQAGIAGSPTTCGTTAPRVTSLVCCVAARVCWCSHGIWWCVGRCWHSCLSSEQQSARQLGKAVVPGFCRGMLAVEEGVSQWSGPRCASRPSGGQRCWSGLVRVGCWWSRAGYGAFYWKQMGGSAQKNRPSSLTAGLEGGLLGFVPAWFLGVVREVAIQLLCFSFYPCEMLL